MAGGITGRMLAASVLLAAVIGGAFAILLLAIDGLRRAEERSRQAQDVLVAANHLERLLLDLETGQRGYILTREERFLQPWQAARAEFPGRAAILLTLVVGEPVAEREVREIARRERAYINSYSVPLVNAASRGDPSARSLAASDEGRRRVDAMRAGFDRLIAAERAADRRSQASAQAAANRASAAAAAGIGGSIALIALYGGYLARAIVRPVRRAAQMAGRLAGGDLSARMTETGVGEIGALERSFNVMGGSLERSRAELSEIVAEQAALRRVATLVARGGTPAEVFAVVAEEVGRLLGARITRLLRYEVNLSATVVGGWSASGTHVRTGTRLDVEGEGLAVTVLETGRATRTERFSGPPGSVADEFVRDGVSVGVGVGSPIEVEGRLWGVAIAASSRAESLPPESEPRIAAFTELVATAISNAQAREDLRRIADEQSALRRVATLVAQAAQPPVLFAAVAEEVGRFVPVDHAFVFRYEPDDAMTVVGEWAASGEGGTSGGTRHPLRPHGVGSLVRETGRPARAEGDADDPGVLEDRAAVGVPITVEGRLWGLVAVTSAGEAPPPGTEDRLVGFTGLVATAIANAESRAELAASRARIVTMADETRRRIERDLHDGAQQRLVSLALQLRAAQASVPQELEELRADLGRMTTGLDDALDELREMARGIHPAILAEGGLGPALRALARRSQLPVELHVRVDERQSERVEVAAYYVASEALTNAAKHARASVVTMDVDADQETLRVLIRDDGVGGADVERGSGLVGLMDRVEALGGRITLRSTRGAGTRLEVELPLRAGGVDRRR